MRDISEALLGIEKIKIRFLALLEERQGVIAHHALAAWESTDPNEVRSHLNAAQNILHQIAGSAGSLGFDSLGQVARDCENEIIAHLEGPDGKSTPLPFEIIGRMDAFVSMSQALLTEGA
tara:strand:+ start:1043 stop:1402 length:360 start_codon:yes stop_codon:yes gene_type:complete